MSSYNELVSILKELLLNRFYPMPYYISALLGDGNGNVLVPNRPDYNYVRFNRASSETFEVFNKEVSQPVDGWPVKIGEFPWQPGLIQVVGTDWSAYSQTGWGDSVASIQAHAPTHEWPAFAPGSDPVNVYPRSLTQLRAQAVGSGSSSVYVTAYEYDWTGTSQIWPGVPPLDFSAKPPTGSMLYMGVYLNPASNALGVVSGSTTVYTDALQPPIPAWPLGVFPSGYVRLYGGQAGITERDIRPAQRLYNSTLMFTGTSSGGGWPFANVLTVSTTDPDADYATVTAAIAAASAGDGILLDMESSAETITVNKAVYLIGLARGGTVFTSSITITAAARLYNIKVTHDSVVNARGFICNQTDVAVLYNCEAVTNGSTTSRAIEQTAAGSTQVYGGYYESSGAGTSFEVFVSSGSVILYNQPVLFTGAISGNAAGQYTTSGGDLFFVNGTGMSGGVWLYKTGGTRDYYTSLTLAAAAAGAGDIIHLFPGTYTLTSQLAYGAAFTIEGEGPETIINCATNSVSLLLLNSAGAALRNLKITHSGAGILNSGVYITANATVENVTVILSGAATANYAVLQQGGTATLTNVTATASGATTNHAYRNDTGDATVTLSGGSFSGTQLDIYGERTGSFLNIYGALLAHNTVSYTGAVERSGNTSFERGRPNPVINGAFQVWQRGTSFAAIANGTYSADRWFYAKVGAAVHTVSRSTDVPTVAQAGQLVPYSFLADCTTIDGTIAAGDFVNIQHRMEGYNWQHLAQRQIAVSFWVKATKTGVYCFSIRNSGVDRSYVAEYTVNTTDTWEYKTITVPASPSAGTWDYTNGVGAYLTWALSCGSDFQTTANAWQTGNFFGTSNQVNATDDTANNFRLAMVKVEPGAIATPFPLPDYQAEFNRCLRYAWVLDASSNTATIFNGSKYATANVIVIGVAPVTMRAAPALTHNITGYTAGAPGTTTVALFDLGTGGFKTITGALTVSLGAANTQQISLALDAGTSWSGTAGDLCQLRIGPSVVAVLSAEL